MAKLLYESQGRFLAHVIKIACSKGERSPVEEALRYLLISRWYLGSSRYYNIFRFCVNETDTDRYRIWVEIDDKSTNYLDLSYDSALKFLKCFRPRILSLHYWAIHVATLSNARDFMEFAEKIHLDIRLPEANLFRRVLPHFSSKIRALNCDPAFLAGMDVLPAMRLDVFCILVLASADQLNGILRHQIKKLVLDFYIRRIPFNQFTEGRAIRSIEHLEVRRVDLLTPHDHIGPLITFFEESPPKMFTLQLHVFRRYAEDLTREGLVALILVRYLSIRALVRRCQQTFTRFFVRLDLNFNLPRGIQLDADWTNDLTTDDLFENFVLHRDGASWHRVSMIKEDARTTLQVNINLSSR